MIGTPFFVGVCQYPKPFHSAVMFGVDGFAKPSRNDFAIALHCGDIRAKSTAVESFGCLDRSGRIFGGDLPAGRKHPAKDCQELPDSILDVVVAHTSPPSLSVVLQLI